MSPTKQEPQQKIDAMNDRFLRIGMRLARDFFAQRGAGAEVNIDEVGLAAVCAMAAELGSSKAPRCSCGGITDHVECPICGAVAGPDCCGGQHG